MEKGLFEQFLPHAIDNACLTIGRLTIDGLKITLKLRSTVKSEQSLRQGKTIGKEKVPEKV